MTDLACPGAQQTSVQGTTLAHRLEQHARARPDDRAVSFVDDDGGLTTRTWSELAAGARAVAAALRHLPRTRAQPRALLLLPQDASFLDALFGCFFAGVCAIPAHVPTPSRLAQTLPRLSVIVAEARPQVVLTTCDLAQVRTLVPGLVDIPCIAIDEIGIDDSPASGLNVAVDDLAILQYSSGSTGSPRGVMVSHQNLMANEALIEDAFEHTSSSVFLSWLPFQHDMGLIGMLLQPVFVGAEFVMMTPPQFLKHPLRWLREITEHRATTSGAPNFAYEMCVAAAQAEGAKSLAGLDLSSWNLAFVGAEPIRAATLERFAATFASCGFRRESLYGCYGLAEATLLVSGGQRSDSPALWRDPRGITRVSSGRQRAGLEVAIVASGSGESGIRCDAGVEGEIWVRGASVARGYFGHEQQSRETFSASLDGSAWLRTGDLGYLVDGELYVTGREKDVVVRNGLNYAAEDIEHTVAQLHTASLRPGGCAAFGDDDGNRERLVIVQEIARDAVDDWEGVADKIVSAVAVEHGAPADVVVFVQPGSIPRTTSGKIRRGECHSMYARAELGEVHRHWTGLSA
jgi:acyl-CoA synthetase (AMP-forming)/AMP-acid ligase II